MKPSLYHFIILTHAAKTENHHKYFLYARKSTDTEDKQARSIDDQLAELHDFARIHGLAVTDTFIERQTAKVPGRPIFNSMLDRIEHGEANAILAWHPDRLSRNSIDGGKLIYFVDRGIILDLKFPIYTFDATSQGKFTLAIAFGQSKYYVDNLGENVKRALRQKAKSGILPGRAPLGYLNDPRTKTIVLEPSRAPLVRKMFELYATGRYTLLLIRKVINELGLTGHNEKPLALSEVYRILRNPFYYGLLRYGGELYEGRHEAIITKSLFENAQAAMSRRSKPRWRPTKPRLFQGVFRCAECNACITTETKKGFNYLRCTKKLRPCSQPYLREDAAIAQIQDIIKLVSLPEQLIESITSQIQLRKQQASTLRHDDLLRLRSAIAELDTKLERLTIAYLDTLVSIDEYRRAKAAILGQKTLLKEELARVEHNSNDWLERIESFLKDLNQAISITSKTNPLEIRDFLITIGSNLVLKNRIIHYEFKALWNYVATEPQKLGLIRGAPVQRASIPLKNAPKFQKGLRPARNSNERVLFRGLEHVIKNGPFKDSEGFGLERESAPGRNRTFRQKDILCGPKKPVL